MAEILERDEGNTSSVDGSKVDTWLSSGYILKIGERWSSDWIWDVSREESRSIPWVFIQDTQWMELPFLEMVSLGKVGGDIQVEIGSRQLDKGDWS